MNDKMLDILLDKMILSMRKNLNSFEAIENFKSKLKYARVTSSSLGYFGVCRYVHDDGSILPHAILSRSEFLFYKNVLKQINLMHELVNKELNEKYR